MLLKKIYATVTFLIACFPVVSFGMFFEPQEENACFYFYVDKDKKIISHGYLYGDKTILFDTHADTPLLDYLGEIKNRTKIVQAFEKVQKTERALTFSYHSGYTEKDNVKVCITPTSTDVFYVQMKGK